MRVRLRASVKKITGEAEHMKKPAIILIILGALLIVGGAILSFTGGPAGASTELTSQCQQKMKTNNADASMVDKCSDFAFATAMTATDANAAAQAISASNRGEVGGNGVAMFLIGLGIAVAAGGMVVQRKL
jgi:hypothetical protein